MESFIKRYMVERTNKAEIRSWEQSEQAQSFGENLWHEIYLKGPQRQKQTQEQNKTEWASSAGLCQRHKLQHPHQMKARSWGQFVSSFLSVSNDLTHVTHARNTRGQTSERPRCVTDESWHFTTPVIGLWNRPVKLCQLQYLTGEAYKSNTIFNLLKVTHLTAFEAMHAFR